MRAATENWRIRGEWQDCGGCAASKSLKMRCAQFGRPDAIEGAWLLSQYRHLSSPHFPARPFQRHRPWARLRNQAPPSRRFPGSSLNSCGTSCCKARRSKTRHSKTQFSRAQFSRAQFSRAQFSRAQFSRAQFSRAQYSKAQFSKANPNWTPPIAVPLPRPPFRLRLPRRRRCPSPSPYHQPNPPHCRTGKRCLASSIRFSPTERRPPPRKVYRSPHRPSGCSISLQWPLTRPRQGLLPRLHRHYPPPLRPLCGLTRHPRTEARHPNPRRRRASLPSQPYRKCRSLQPFRRQSPRPRSRARRCLGTIPHPPLRNRSGVRFRSSTSPHTPRAPSRHTPRIP